MTFSPAFINGFIYRAFDVEKDETSNRGKSANPYTDRAQRFDKHEWDKGWDYAVYMIKHLSEIAPELWKVLVEMELLK